MPFHSRELTSDSRGMRAPIPPEGLSLPGFATAVVAAGVVAAAAPLTTMRVPPPPKAKTLTTLIRELRGKQEQLSVAYLRERDAVIAEEKTLHRDIAVGDAREQELQRQIDVACADVDALRATVAEDARELPKLTARRDQLRRSNLLLWAQVRELERSALKLPPMAPSLPRAPRVELPPPPQRRTPATPTLAAFEGINAMSDEQLRRIVAAAASVPSAAADNGWPSPMQP